MKTWIGKVLLNTFLDYKRKEESKRKLVVFSTKDIDDELRFKVVDHPRVAKNEQECLEREVRIRMNKLKPKEKEVLHLLYHEGSSYQKIAQTLDMKEGSLKATIFRIKEKMRNTTQINNG